MPRPLSPPIPNKQNSIDAEEADGDIPVPSAIYTAYAAYGLDTHDTFYTAYAAYGLDTHDNIIYSLRCLLGGTEF